LGFRDRTARIERFRETAFIPNREFKASMAIRQGVYFRPVPGWFKRDIEVISRYV
jgi:hypothetical protein